MLKGFLAGTLEHVAIEEAAPSKGLGLMVPGCMNYVISTSGNKKLKCQVWLVVRGALPGGSESAGARGGPVDMLEVALLAKEVRKEATLRADREVSVAAC